MDDTELLREFAVESQEHLADIENQLLTLESQGSAMDIALVNTVFRAIHSIKGAAGFMGLDTLGGLAHRAEEVLGLLRSHELQPTSVVINTLLRATDRLKELIGEVENSNQQDVSAHIVALEEILAGPSESGEGVVTQPTRPAPPTPPTPSSPPAPSAAAAPATTPSSWPSSSLYAEFLPAFLTSLAELEQGLRGLDQAPSDVATLVQCLDNLDGIQAAAEDLEFHNVAQISAAGSRLLRGIDAGHYSMDPQISESLMGAVGVLRKTFQSIEATGEEGPADHQFTIDFLNAVGSVKGIALGVAERSTAPRATVPDIPSGREPAPSDGEIAPILAEFAPTRWEVADVSPTDPEPLPAPTAPPLKSESSKSAAVDTAATDSTIRVDVALLDKLMTRVGELVLARNQILQFQSKIEDPGLQNAVQRLNLITSELQEGVMKTRMQPIGNVWTKFPRLVRDLAALCEKQVRIEMEGKETELDKTIIEAIKDPLTHLVRNTVDHGIEKPAIRRKMGKPAEGCLTLKAFHEGGQVNIEIVDDGGGLNLDRIKAKAIEKGLISGEDAARMSERDAGNLIFLPGFSTAEQVSSVSGRGVGMDVVRTNIEKIGGTVDLHSQPGLGTTIKIKIPLTLAIIPALIVSASGDRYAIPQVNLLELVRLENQSLKPSVEWIQGAPVYRLRGRLLPLVSLRQQLGQGSVSDFRRADCLNIVVLKADDRQFGLVVDRILDSEEIVVKPLGKQLKHVPIYSGTTIMGDGRVSLIMDVLGLAHSAHLLTRGKDRGSGEVGPSTAARGQNERTLLVIAVGADGRAALPLDQVTRLEKVPRRLVEQSHQREVIQYRGEIMPLLRLSGHTASHGGHDPNDLMDVVVYTHGRGSVGVVVDQILDIAAGQFGSQSADGTQLPDAPPSGAIVIDGHVTDLLDLPSLVTSAML